jgi:hypothetical protein
MSFLLSCFVFNKIREQEGRTGYAWSRSQGRGVGGGSEGRRWPKQCIHVSKFKNENIKKIKIIK